MRKMIAALQMSVDGFIEGPNGESACELDSMEPRADGGGPCRRGTSVNIR
jgi:hypothetical protein